MLTWEHWGSKWQSNQRPQDIGREVSERGEVKNKEKTKDIQIFGSRGIFNVDYEARAPPGKATTQGPR